ncbi:unnamed protein product [Schistosoma margrebowiei]|uniref:Uncharacterized protein n=1 Tax=Schistosoma margrebowiei TaxID=48269 RepID=A0A183MI24_9TREM|nr:unnamed protein product [Schistosoma margrebowiei]
MVQSYSLLKDLTKCYLILFIRHFNLFTYLYLYLGSIIDEHGGSDADVKARIGKAISAYLQLRNVWNSKQLSMNQHQGQDFQYKCQDSSTVWGRNLENHESNHPENTRVY